VNGTNGASWYDIPFRVIPARGQIAENSSKPPSKESCDVFHKEVARSNLANQPSHLEPEAATFSINSSPDAGEADVLTWESTADEIDAAGPRLSIQFCNVSAYGTIIQRSIEHAGFKDFLAVGINFAVRDRLETAGSFEAKGKPSNPAEQVHHANHSSTCFSQRQCSLHRQHSEQSAYIKQVCSWHSSSGFMIRLNRQIYRGPGSEPVPPHKRPDPE